MSDYPSMPPSHPYPGNPPPEQQPPSQQPAQLQPNWPAGPMPPQVLSTRTDVRVHQVAWALFWLMMANVCGALAAVTAVTVIGAIVFGLVAIVLWIVALVFSIMALRRT